MSTYCMPIVFRGLDFYFSALVFKHVTYTLLTSYGLLLC